MWLQMLKFLKWSILLWQQIVWTARKVSSYFLASPAVLQVSYVICFHDNLAWIKYLCFEIFLLKRCFQCKWFVLVCSHSHVHSSFSLKTISIENYGLQNPIDFALLPFYSVIAEAMNEIPGSCGRLHASLNFLHIWRFEMGLMVSMFPVLCSKSY